MKKIILLLLMLSAFGVNADTHLFKLIVCNDYNKEDCNLKKIDVISGTDSAAGVTDPVVVGGGGSGGGLGDATEAAPIAGNGEFPVGKWNNLLFGTYEPKTIELQPNLTYMIVTSGKNEANLIINDRTVNYDQDDIRWTSPPDDWYGYASAVWVTTGEDAKMLTLKFGTYTDPEQVMDYFYAYPVASSGAYPTNWNWNQLGVDLMQPIVVPEVGSVALGSWKVMDFTATTKETVVLEANKTYFFTTSGQTDTKIRLVNFNRSFGDDDTYSWNNNPVDWYGKPDAVWYRPSEREEVEIQLTPYSGSGPAASGFFATEVSGLNVYPIDWNWPSLTGVDLMSLPEREEIPFTDASTVVEYRFLLWDYSRGDSQAIVMLRNIDAAYTVGSFKTGTDIIDEFTALLDNDFETLNGVASLSGQCDLSNLNSYNFKTLTSADISANRIPDILLERYLEVDCVSNEGEGIRYYIAYTVGESPGW